jgi:N-acetylneuraminate synthase/sialic acid synthase
MRSFTIAGREITQDSKPFVIAEIGNNHNGSLKLCKELIKRAKQNGADAVKLQKRNPRTLYTGQLFDSPYTGDNSFGSTYGLHREALEFDKENWQELIEFAKKQDILLFSTAFDVESVEFLEQFDLPAYKVASGCLKDIPLINRLIKTRKPLIISTGGAEWRDIDRVYTVLTANKPFFCFLHCTMEYPTAPENVNLKIIPAMMDRYPDAVIGFSDHTIGSWAIESAYRFGAQIFEKHFTSNRALPGPDHALSIEPPDLQQLIHNLERIRAAEGTPEKRWLPVEQKGYYKMAKGIYARGVIDKGETVTPEGVIIKSPADGLEPYHYDEIIGKTTKVCLLPETPIIADMLENYST